MDKYFLITIDTEGDNQWAWHEGMPITTRNTKYIPKFQNLCEEYGFKPVYLTNYEMAMDDKWVQYAKKKAQNGLCEIGMHLHAWNAPPYYFLKNKYGGNAYITEYPEDIIEEKVKFQKDLLEDRFETKIVTHRSGRWATNEYYLKTLVKYGLNIDCSVVPQLDLSNIAGCNKNTGNDYTGYPTIPYEIVPGMLEIPMTSRKIKWLAPGSLKHKIRTMVFGDNMWLRPIYKSFEYLKKLTEVVEAENNQHQYLEFMIHSSELMLGGSPYYNNAEDIEKQYSIMEEFFNYVRCKGYQGVCMCDYSIL